MNTHYKDLSNTYPVFCGAEFWQHLTGDDSFYYRLARAFGEVVEEDKINGSALIKSRIEYITKEIESKGGRVV